MQSANDLEDVTHRAQLEVLLLVGVAPERAHLLCTCHTHAIHMRDAHVYTCMGGMFEASPASLTYVMPESLRRHCLHLDALITY